MKDSIDYAIVNAKNYEKLFHINIENGSKSNITRLTPELVKKIKKMDEFSEQIRFLAKNGKMRSKNKVK